MGKQLDLFSAPYVRGSRTSEAAATSVTPELARLEALVFECISRAGADGRTDDEIEIELAMRHQTASARRRELVLKGRVRDSGRRRKTSSGRMAAIWVVT